MTTKLMEVEPGVAQRRPTGRQLAPRPRHGASAVLLGLQRSAGNAAVSREIVRQRSVLLRCTPGHLTVVQRCGPVACDCAPEERAEHERKHSTEKEEDESKASSVQRQLVGSGPLTVQRHAGWRTKPRLEVPELDPLQYAASRTDRALEFGRAQNPVEVTRLQEGLTRAGYAVPLTGTYDAGTRSAVSRFQASHGIPYPTGLQAGPKTLSTLDDHLLGGPVPKPECTRYETGERAASFGPGGAAPSGGFGQHLRLVNFAVGVHLLKFDHQLALDEFIKRFDLANLASAQSVQGGEGLVDH